MNYYISDLHLFHENAIRFDQRPFSDIGEMHEAILTNWNGRVTNGDTVYIVGDIAMRGKNEDLIAFVARLKGRKILIKGNHDDLRDLRYQQLFSDVFDYHEVKDMAYGEAHHVVMSHYPILSWNRMMYGSILLYGHVHDGAEEKYFQECLEKMQKIDSWHVSKSLPVARNVGCMMPVMDYTPRTLEEILCR